MKIGKIIKEFEHTEKSAKLSEYKIQIQCITQKHFQLGCFSIILTTLPSSTQELPEPQDWRQIHLIDK